MTDHLYYHDSFLCEFDAEVLDSSAEPRPCLILDRTAFYPTSGGQVFDTGTITFADAGDSGVRVVEVVEQDGGTILHLLETPVTIEKGSHVHGQIDVERRRDHMQQHSGQHVLSAAFVRLFDMPTVSFHMGVDTCSIDLDAKILTSAQVEAAEKLANNVIMEDRPVAIRFATQEEVRGLVLRKLPPVERDKLRLIDVHDFDLTACGGTHVSATGQIGCILLRKIEKVRQGWRVEFVCGQRAVATARRDYSSLAESAAMLSTQLWEIPQVVRKLQKETRGACKAREQLLEELADLYATRLLSDAPIVGGRRVIVRTFSDRGAAFIKLLAQRLTRQTSDVVALLGSASDPAALVFAQSAGLPFDMGALLKEALAQLGGRGGGTKDMAQGGPARAEGLENVLGDLAARRVNL
jgi:alanyl-tRNA synthetase